MVVVYRVFGTVALVSCPGPLSSTTWALAVVSSNMQEKEYRAVRSVLLPLAPLARNDLELSFWN